MPLYEFVCHDCTARFERLMSFSQEANHVCPVCQSMHTVRQVSMPSIHFRGSGFYQTDVRAEADKKKKAKDKDANDGKDTKEPAEQESTATPHQTEEPKTARTDKAAVEAAGSQSKKVQNTAD